MRGSSVLVHPIERGGVDHRAVDADPQIAAVARGHDAAVAGAEAARHAGLQRELCGNSRAAHSALTPSSIGAGPHA